LPLSLGTTQSSFTRKRALADRTWVIVSVQLFRVPEHPPAQPLKAEPFADLATRVTVVP
jgi:hypothetical protein